MGYIDGCIERSKDAGMFEGDVSDKSGCAGSVSDYAYESIEEYEEIAGYRMSDAFRLGWTMARTTNAARAIFFKCRSIEGTPSASALSRSKQ